MTILANSRHCTGQNHCLISSSKWSWAQSHSVDIEQAFTQADKLPFSPRALHKTMDAYFKSQGVDTICFEESVWRRPAGGKYADDIYVSAHVEDVRCDWSICHTGKMRSNSSIRVHKVGVRTDAWPPRMTGEPEKLHCRSTLSWWEGLTGKSSLFQGSASRHRVHKIKVSL